MAETLHEITRHSINIMRNEEPRLIWHDSFLTIKLNTGVNTFELIYNSECLDKKISSLEFTLDCSKTSPAITLFTPNIINSKISNMELQEMIEDPTLWPHNPQLLQEETYVKTVEWSPFGLIDNHQSVLAVLNNVGGIDLYARRLKWQCVLQMSKTVNQQFADSLGSPSQFQQLKTAVHALTSTAICWSPIVHEDKTCFFVTGQKNGYIMIWLINSIGLELNATFVECFELISNEIVSLVWIPRENNTFCIICSDVVGQITLLNCELNGCNIKLLSSKLIWSYKDKMQCNLSYIEAGEKILLFCNKNRHLLVFFIDENFDVIDQYINNINDYRISSICKHKENIIVTTINAKIYKLNHFIEENKITINYLNVECKDVITPTHEVHSISYSHNSVLCALVLIDRKVLVRKDSFKLDLLIMSNYNYTIEYLVNLLLENPSKKLTYFIDVIELLRLKCMKEKQSPILDDELYNKCSKDIYLLKVYLILLANHSLLEKTFKIPSGLLTKQKTPEQIKIEILTLNAKSIITNLYKKSTENQLTYFDSESFVCAKRFLEYYYKSNDKKISDVFSSETLDIVNADEFKYVCQCCDLQLTEFVCKNNHLNMYCMITFTPIEYDNYLVCNRCHSTARVELLVDNPICLFCDYGLNLVV